MLNRGLPATCGIEKAAPGGSNWQDFSDESFCGAPGWARAAVAGLLIHMLPGAAVNNIANTMGTKIRVLMSWVRRVSQFRRDRVCLLELRLRLCLLSLLSEGECQIEMRFRVTRLQPNRFIKFGSRCCHVIHLQ